MPQHGPAKTIAYAENAMANLGKAWSLTETATLATPCLHPRVGSRPLANPLPIIYIWAAGALNSVIEGGDVGDRQTLAGHHRQVQALLMSKDLVKGYSSLTHVYTLVHSVYLFILIL